MYRYLPLTLRQLGKLCLISLISFGCHFSRATLPIFGMILIEQGEQGFTPEGLGVLIGCSFIPSIVAPSIIGHIIDSTNQLRTMAISLLVLTILGQLVFVYAIVTGQYQLAVAAQVIFGSGASAVTAIQRVIGAYHMEESFSFSTAIYVCVSCFSKFLGKGLTGPITV
jgi:MFS family permease